MLNRLSLVLDESLMGFLALTGLSLWMTPLLFEVPEELVSGFNFAKWLIIGLFGLEYTVNFILSTDRRKFIFAPWRMLDAVIIIVPLFSLFPGVSNIARSTPTLRILKLFSLLLFGPRVGHALQRTAMPLARQAPVGHPQVTVLRSGDLSPQISGWDALLQWIAAPTEAWMHASNLSPERLMEIASAAGVPHVLIEAALQESSYPRIESDKHWTALTISLLSEGETIRRDPVLLLVLENGVLSLAIHPLDVQQSPANSAVLPWGPRCALHIIRLVLARDEKFTGRLEGRVRQFEELPAIESPESFFRQTLSLKRILSTIKSDLWRLRGLLEMLADGRRQLPGFAPEQREIVAPLIEEADYLYETVDNIRESLLSLIELHINIAAHDTTRFMRLLAIVTTLALIPAVAGGLLGMNLVDAPWPVTLGQVAFGTLVLTLAMLYTFMAKGWLR